MHGQDFPSSKPSTLPTLLERAAKFVALLFLMVGVIAVVTNAANPRWMDFTSYWAAAALAASGNAIGAYDLDTHRAMEGTAAPLGGLMPFPYPPPFLLALLPFGLTPYAVAFPLWLVSTFALFRAAVERLSPGSIWIAAAMPAVVVNAIIGQNAFLTAALFLGGIALLRTRPWVAGLLLGGLIIKPHLAILIPVALVASRDWRAFAGAALSSLGLLAAGAVAFGVASYAAWIAQAPLYAAIVADGLVGWHKMASLYASLRLAGADEMIAWTVHASAAMAAAWCVWRTWAGNAELLAKGAVLAAATVLASPYLYLYDTLILVLPFLWLARAGERPAVLAALWAILLIGVAQNWVWNDAVNPIPLVSLALIGLIVRRLSRQRRAVNRPGPRRSDAVSAGCDQPVI